MLPLDNSGETPNMATLAYHIKDIRNIALAGHGASAKTSLADALLFAAGATERRGSVNDGTSFSDVEDEEKRRHITIDCHLLHLEWKGRQVHLVNSPGYPDFIGNALSALAAVENVLVTVSANTGIEMNTRRLFQEAGRLGLGRFVALTKMDADNVNFLKNLESLRETFGPQCVPFNLPVGQGPTFSGIIDALVPPENVPENCPLSPEAAHTMVVEQIVEFDENLMGRYLEGEPIAPEELREAAHKAVAAGKLVPVVCLSVRKDVGLRELLDIVSDCGLSPDELHRLGALGEDADFEITPEEDGELIALVFKTAIDPFMGKLSYLHIISGHLRNDTSLMNNRTGKTGKPGHLYRVQGKQQEEVEEAIAGDIVAVPKFDDLHISDTVTNATSNGQTPHVVLNPIKFPTPMVPRRRTEDPRGRAENLRRPRQDRRRRPDLHLSARCANA